MIPTSSVPDPPQGSTFILSSNDLTGLVELSDIYRFAGGGYGDIFEGRHQSHGKVALKRPHNVLDEIGFHRFLREVDIWCGIKHQYILPCLGRCRIGRDLYMVTPFIENGDLMACICQGKPLNRKKIIYQTGEALAYLHEQGIVHGDIKGSNILVSSEGTAILCDFGLSKVLATMKTSDDKKGVGSIRWMAPEMFQDHGSRTRRSDVYSFGITIAEILSGFTPYHHLKDNNVVMHRVLNVNERPAKEPMADEGGDSYAGLWDVAGKCWDSDILKRPSMDQVLASFILLEAEPEVSLKAGPEAPPIEVSSDQYDDILDSTSESVATSEPVEDFSMVNDLSGLISVDHYPIERGGFSYIFMGIHVLHGKVALKRPRRLLDETQIRRFHRQARLWHNISHQYILPFYGTCMIGRDVYLVSPFIKNGDLANYMKKGVRFDRIKLIYEVALALAHLHALRIVHGAIDVRNILVSDNGSPLLSGFGSVKVLDTMVTSTDAKGSGSVRWMAPELFENAPRSMASDMYSFGITIAEVLSDRVTSGRGGFYPNSVFDVINGGRPPKEPLVSSEGRSYLLLWGIAEMCWAKSPEDRPAMHQVEGTLLLANRVNI